MRRGVGLECVGRGVGGTGVCGVRGGWDWSVWGEGWVGLECVGRGVGGTGMCGARGGWDWSVWGEGWVGLECVGRGVGGTGACGARGGWDWSVWGEGWVGLECVGRGVGGTGACGARGGWDWSVWGEGWAYTHSCCAVSRPTSHAHTHMVTRQGQWRSGLYHGEGTMSHSSGMRYCGMWSNGRPAGEHAHTKHSASIFEELPFLVWCLCVRVCVCLSGVK